MRAIRTEQYLYIRNLKPNRWPWGDPALFLWGKYGKHEKDEFVDGLPPDWRRRPAQQLFNIRSDPACTDNLADDADHAEVLAELREKLITLLRQQGDPRMLGYGDIFESYPRYGRMRPECGGFAERGKYNEKYCVTPPRNRSDSGP
jgi:uncharacterized sulfatase